MTTPPPSTPQPLGMSDFFALEAGEYLDRLDALINGDATPRRTSWCGSRARCAAAR